MLYILLTFILLYLFIPSKKVKFGFFYLKHNLIPLSIIILLISLVIFSEDVFTSAHNGLTLWCNNVVPSLLPFLICLEVLKKTNVISVIGKILEPVIRPIFRIPGCGAFAVVMGMCSGYPVGAKFAASLREANQCSKIEGERLLSFTNTSGPLFIVGAVGIGMLADSKIGFLLLLTHFIAALLVGIVFRFYKSRLKSNNSNLKANILESKIITTQKNEGSNNIKLSQLGGIMGEAIKNSISTLLLVCGFITFFCVVGTVLDKTGMTSLISNLISQIFINLGFSKEMVSPLTTGCLKGILEITSGLKILSASSLDYKILLPIMATILGFGGISVHMQVASIISHTDLSMKPYLLGKTLHGIFAGFITYFILNQTNLFQLEVIETFSSITANQVTSITGSGNLFIIALSVLLLLTLSILLFRKNTYSG